MHASLNGPEYLTHASPNVCTCICPWANDVHHACLSRAALVSLPVTATGQSKPKVQGAPYACAGTSRSWWFEKHGPMQCMHVLAVAWRVTGPTILARFRADRRLAMCARPSLICPCILCDCGQLCGPQSNTYANATLSLFGHMHARTLNRPHRRHQSRSCYQINPVIYWPIDPLAHRSIGSSIRWPIDPSAHRSIVASTPSPP